MTNTTKVLIGMIGAAAAGVALGLLLAPDKGEDTRRKISKATGDWASQLSDLFANAKDELSNLRKKGSRAADDAASRYSGATENFG